jgi:UDP-N-acetylmuramoyl-L-alanyl-D-glutamate--2,6-diaminopimelate ligase
VRLSKILRSVAIKKVTDPNGFPLGNSVPEGAVSLRGRENQLFDTDIGSIHYRAQDVQPGGLFVAIPGLKADGHDFINEALSRGASAVLTQKQTCCLFPKQSARFGGVSGHPAGGGRTEQKTVIVEVENTRKALAAVSAGFYGNPSEKLFIIGITGTNGKTTTSFLIESILVKAGFKVGVIGTINYHFPGKTFNNPVTTPESADLQRILAEMRADGVTHVVMEVSSHAIDLFRIDHCWIDVGVFVNLSQDHLDYHGDMHTYWLCKKRLFTENLTSGPKKGRTMSVINCADEKGKELAGSVCVSSLTAGHTAADAVSPRNLKMDLDGIAGTIATPAGDFDFKSAFVGKHNLENILCATGVGIALHVPLDIIKAGIEDASCVPGRLERIPNDKGRFVYVDYAHTPDALENVLSSLKSLGTGRMICVFGCGGDRDKSKRPRMGQIAGTLCDLVVITSDNPRSENPAEIIDQILEGIKKVCSLEYHPSEVDAGFRGKGYVVQPDRREAIQLGIRVSRPGDSILIAGKGHETYQIIGGTSIQFDDRIEAKAALSSVCQRKTA